MFFLLLLFIAEARAAPDPPPISLVMGMNLSQTLLVPSLTRAAVANAKIVKVRPVPPSKLLLTALHPGKTTVKVWTSDGKELTYSITVLSTELYDQSIGPETEEVVKVSLEFLELDLSLSKSVGFRWPEATQFAASGAYQGGDATGLNYSVSFSTAKGLIQHLLKEGWARVLAKPDLYVRMGEEAVFNSGGEFPVPTSSETYGRYARHIEWKPFGLGVKVRPKSGDNFHISSDIHVEISEMNPSVAIEGIPSLTRRNVDTKMHSLDGETVILSGLVRQTSTSQKESVPLLGSIPLLGPLFFSAKNEGHDESEVFMAITFSLASRLQDRERLEQFRDKWNSPNNS